MTALVENLGDTAEQSPQCLFFWLYERVELVTTIAKQLGDCLMIINS